MNFGDIDIPDKLYSALQADELVVFAGAGVSYAAPSDLPMFDGLAQLIGEGSGVEREGKRLSATGETEFGESADRYLGRLMRRCVKVHERAVERLVGTHTSPHPLHIALLRLFPSPEKIRLVTTNFDTHFTASAAELQGEKVSEFHGPALPLGSDFTGIIYLHGCAAKMPLKIVLTDEDFGRAYLTDGWARRFLVGMFSRYTVMFVGYSHNDPVMNYLARGLPPEHRGRRFALVPAGEEEPWRHLEITPLPYLLRSNSTNRHESLVESITRWAGFTKQNLLDKASRIREVAAQGPPLDIETEGQMELAIKDVVTLRPFVEHARSSGWLGWLEDKGVLKALFSLTGDLTSEHEMLMNWLIKNFLDEQPQSILGLIQRSPDGYLHPRFCDAIWRRLRYSKEQPPENLFSLWTAVLLSQPDQVLRQQSWAELLICCQLPRDRAIFRQVFERATRPNLVLKPHWSVGDEAGAATPEVDFEIELDHDTRYYLRESWSSMILPNLGSLVSVLEPILTGHLRSVRECLAATDSTWGMLDPISYGRASIEAHVQNSRDQGIDFLIDAARDVLQHLQSTSSERAFSTILNWIESEAPLLLRLAVHGMARQPQRSADQRTQFLIEHGMLFDVVCRPEVFLLLRLNYADLAFEARSSLLVQIAAGPPAIPANEMTEEDRQNEVFQRLALVSAADPSCELARLRLEDLQAKFPHFRAREHPGLLFGSIAEERLSDGGTAQVLEEPPEKFLADLLALPSGGHFSNRREDRACRLWQLVAEDRIWGVAFQRAVREQRIDDESIWRQLANAWREAKPREDEWAPIIEEFSCPDTPAVFLESVVNILENWGRRESDGLPTSQLQPAADIAHRAWREVLSKLSPGEAPSDWLQEAINRPGGYYAQFLLSVLNYQRRAAGDSWHGIPGPMKERLVEITADTSAAAEHGRVILAGGLRWLYGLDRAFAEGHLLPLFDWFTDSRRAEQCWHGFLTWGKWAPNYRDILLPNFAETVRRLSQIDGQRDDEFQYKLAQHVVRLSWFVLENPLANNWLLDCLRDLRREGRTEFAHGVELTIEDTDAGDCANKWNVWLERCWRLRLDGIPSALLPSEADHMVGWALGLVEVFPKAMTLVREMRAIATFHQIRLLHRLNKANLVRLHPQAAADLVLIYLETKPPYLRVNDDDLRATWHSLNHCGLSDGWLRRLRDALFAAGIDPESLDTDDQNPMG